MNYNPKINLDRFEASFKAIDAHTAGEFCRIVYSGFTKPEGNTPIERKHWLEKNYNHYRTALMLEPRGHHDMFGAYICEPIDPQADFAVFFMDTGGWLNMCGHCTIGAVTVAVETGMVEAKEPYTEVVLEAPAGIIRTKAEVKDGKVLGVTLENVPAFLYKPNQKVVIDGKEITFDISFGGSFFALVDTDKLGLVDEINEKTVPYLTQLGMKLLHTINKEIKVQHPRLDITSVDLIEFYGHNVSPDANKRNVVIFGEGSADRSPCGTGTSAKLGTLYAKGELKVGEPFIYESFMGTKFKGVIEKEVDECGYKAVIPLITGTAYLTGEATYAIDPIDPLKYGLIVG